MNNKSAALWLALAMVCVFSGCRAAQRTETVAPLFLGVTPSMETPARILIEAYHRAYPQAMSFQITVLPADNIPDALNQNRISAAVQWDEPTAGYWSAAIGWTGILIIVNPQNSLDSISSDRARKIFLGLIDRWEDLGGSAGAIRCITYEPDIDIGNIFQRNVLAQSSIADGAIAVPTSSAMQQEIRKDRYSIGYIPGFDLSGDVHPLKIDQVTAEYPNLLSGKYPYAIPIFLLSKDPAPAVVLQFAGWAQSVSGQSEFLSMNPWE
jgi:ABC-type phosphate transport system substrate-binding protein